MSESELVKQEPQNTDLAALNYGDMAGLGYQNMTQEDMSLSFISILQSNSPELTQGDAKYIEGAKSGMLLDTVLKEVIPGNQGIVFVPVLTQHVFTEWVPRSSGGGYVGSHDANSDEVRQARASAEKFGKYKLNGNDLVETFYLFGMILTESGDIDRPAVVAITSTKIKPYKAIMTAVRTCKVRAPLFAHRLRITTAIEKNAKGTFFNFHFAPLNTPKPNLGENVIASLIPPVLIDEQNNSRPNPILTAGQELCEQIAGGRMKMDQSQSGGNSPDEPAPF